MLLLEFLVNLSDEIIFNMTSDDKSTWVVISFSEQANIKYGGDISSALLILNRDQYVTSIEFKGKNLMPLRKHIENTGSFESLPCFDEQFSTYNDTQSIIYNCLRDEDLY